jgi:hypothetical protein
LVRQTPEAEQIGNTGRKNWKWNYRLPYSLEELSEDQGFISLVRGLVAASQRN